MTWICRTWWITFKKRCSHWPLPLSQSGSFCLKKSSNWSQIVYWMHLRLKQETTVCFVCFFCLSEGFHRRLHATYSSCSLWVTSCETALPSAHAGTFMSLGFPTGEALTGRMPSTDQHYVSKYTLDFTFHSFLFPPSSSAVDGTTTLIGLGTSTLIVHMTTPALSAVVCLIPAVLLFPGRSVFLCLAFNIHNMYKLTLWLKRNLNTNLHNLKIMYY